MPRAMASPTPKIAAYPPMMDELIERLGRVALSQRN
jgi:hypothetical protein